LKIKWAIQQPNNFSDYTFYCHVIVSKQNNEIEAVQVLNLENGNLKWNLADQLSIQWGL